MRMTKKITSIVLAVLMVVSMMSVMAISAGATDYVDSNVRLGDLAKGDTLSANNDMLYLEEYQEYSVIIKGGTYRERSSYDPQADDTVLQEGQHMMYITTNEHYGPELNVLSDENILKYYPLDAEGDPSDKWYVLSNENNTVTLAGYVPAAPVDYYIVGSMNNWEISDAYKLDKNPEENGEYMFTDLTVSANTELKVKDSNGAYYPDGMDNNFKLNDAGTYDLYFRPNGNGGGLWYYGTIFANNFRPAPATPAASTAAELTAAIANAQNGDTIKLAADITLDSPITVDKEITIDGGSYTVTSAGTIFDVAATGKLTLKDGTYSDTTENENWESFGYTINTAGELIIDGAAVTSTDIAAISAVDGTVTVNSGSVTGAHYAIYNMGADVVINGGTFESTGRTSKSNGSAVPDYAIGQEAGKTTVNGGTIKGFGGIIVNGGDLKVTDGSIDTSANTNSWRPIHIASAYAEINAEITGGTFKAYKEAIYVQNGANGQSVAISGGSFTTTRSKTASNFVDKTNGDIAVSGGTFNRPVGIDQCADNAAPKDNGDKTYTVQLGDYVAKTNKGKYETLAEAVAAAQNGDTIKLLADVTLSESLEIPAEKSFTLDLNGYDISGNVNDQMIKNNGTVVVDDTSITHGHIYNTNIEKQGNAAFVNYGTATVKNGYFGDKNSDMTDANDVNRGAGFQNYGTAVIDGGYFTACDNFTNPEGGEIGYAYAIINYGDITINDATVYGKNNGNLANDEGTMVVNGGDFSLNKLEKNVYYSIYNGSASAETTVNGGTFKNGGKALTYTGEGTMDIKDGNFTFDKLEQSTGNSSISGGTFSKRVESRCCAEGYIAVENSDGTFGVAQDDNPLNSLLRKASEIADNNLFKLNNDYYCGTLLGVQKKAAISGASKTSEDGKQEDAEGNDMRFVAVLETNLLRKADDYGFVLAKVGSGKNTTNTKFDNLKMGDDRAKTISAKGTYNNIMIKNAKNGLKYGDPTDNTTAYKYVTCAVNGVSTTEKVVARFYVTINGKTYYAKYAGHVYQYTGCTAGVNSKGTIV